MESSQDKQWAKEYILDPLTAPEPSQETGPGTHFNSTLRKSSPNGATTTVYPSPPTSASPSRSSFHPSNPFASASSASSSHRQQAFGGYSDGPSQRKNLDEITNDGKGRRRGSSLGQRYPGDNSNRPLDIIRKESKLANRSPHLRKKHIPGADSIDSLDASFLGGPYHHGGPYDATLMARNTSYKNSPVEAVRGSNEEALRATPRENIRDALDKHVPLQGVAVIPPGMRDLSGREMRYEEGADLMREPEAGGGAYKRWPGEKYLPEDLKGKGEPSYSIEKALKEHKHNHRRIVSDGHSEYEMQTQLRPHNNRQRSVSGNEADLSRASGSNSQGSTLGVPGFDVDAYMQRSNSTGRSVGGGLKKRFGSIRRSKKTADV